MAFNLNGLFDGDGGGIAGGMLGQSAVQSATPANLNLGSVSFEQDPYQIKVLRPLLEQQGLWSPAWNEWANYQDQGGDSGGSAPETPDFSSLSGMGAGFGDYGGGNRYEALVGANGQEIAGNPYFYDEPALFQGQDLAQAAALVGGGALGMNALFGGLGGAAGAAGGAAASDGGLMLAGEYGGAGALGDASLLTGSSLGTVAQPAAGLTFGGTTGGMLSAANAGLSGGGTPAGMMDSALTPMDVPSAEWQNPTTPTSATPAATLDPSGTLPTGAATGGGLLNALTSNPRLIAGLAGGLLGGAGAEGGGGYSYNGPMPTITRGGWSPSATPTYSQPAPAPRLNVQPGQANSGLWRFMGGQQ